MENDTRHAVLGFGIASLFSAGGLASHLDEGFISPSHGFKEWTDVVIQGDEDVDSEEKSITHEKNYLIRGLEPSTQYEAKLQARNVFGWNQMSDTFRFTTRGRDGISREPTPEAILPEAEMRDLGVKAKDSVGKERASWILLALSLLLFL